MFNHNLDFKIFYFNKKVKPTRLAVTKKWIIYFEITFELLSIYLSLIWKLLAQIRYESLFVLFLHISLILKCFCIRLRKQSRNNLNKNRTICKFGENVSISFWVTTEFLIHFGGFLFVGTLRLCKDWTLNKLYPIYSIEVSNEYK